jgi:hypothetical protein
MRAALRTAADRVGERFRDQEWRSLARGEVGFVEVAPEPTQERWWSSHLAPRSPASVYLAAEPVVAPFLCLAARSALRGVALVSAERVRMLQWEPGHLEDLHSWELTLTSGDWRERKAPRIADPAHFRGVSAAGRDQFAERLTENRHRFLGECGGLASRLAVKRGWEEVVVFGFPQHVDRFRAAFDSSSPDLVLGGEVDLIADPVARLAAAVEEAVERRDAEEDRRLVERALGETQGGTHGVAGTQETLVALEEGRVEHLVVDDARVAPVTPPAVWAGGDAEVGDAEAGELVGSEPFVRRALATGARITPVSGEAADLLESTEGVAALLRY